MATKSKYPAKIISNIAEETGMGMVCFLNPDTLETESVPGPSYGSYECEEFDEYYQEVYSKVKSWQSCVRIEPMEANESFKIMERFIQNQMPDNDSTKGVLWKIISGRKPFMKFKRFIEASDYRQEWFDFRQKELERLVADYLDSLDIDVTAR